MDTMQTTDEQVRQLIRQAEEHMDREEWDEVAELCYQVLALDPVNRKVNVALDAGLAPILPIGEARDDQALLAA